MNSPAYYRDLIDRILNETDADLTPPLKDELKRQQAIRYLNQISASNVKYPQFLYFAGNATTSWLAPFSYLIRGKIPVLSLEFIDGYFDNHLIARIDYNLNVEALTDEEILDLEYVVSTHLKYLGFSQPQVKFVNIESNLIQLSAPGVVKEILKVSNYKKIANKS